MGTYVGCYRVQGRLPRNGPRSPLHRQDAFSIPLKTATLKLDALDPLDPVQSLDQLVG